MFRSLACSLSLGLLAATLSGCSSGPEAATDTQTAAERERTTMSPTKAGYPCRIPGQKRCEQRDNGSIITCLPNVQGHYYWTTTLECPVPADAGGEDSAVIGSGTCQETADLRPSC